MNDIWGYFCVIMVVAAKRFCCMLTGRVSYTQVPILSDRLCSGL